MKKTKTDIFIFLCLTIFLYSCNKAKQESTLSNDPLTGTIQISGAFALYPMVVKWSQEFKKLHPNVRIDISGGGAGKGMTDVLSGVVDLGMISREIYPEELNKGAFPVSVVKDAVIITINARNPEIETIRKKGLTKEKAEKIWTNQLKKWGEVLDNSSTLPIHVFTRSDACGAGETFTAWLDKRQENLRTTSIYGDPGIAAAVQRDKVAIGYNNIAYVYDQTTKQPFEGIAVMPIDINGDGKIDPNEDFYNNVDSLMLAIQDGRYPAPPARDLYLVTKEKPKRAEILAFLDYILTQGQQYASHVGFVGLTDEKLTEELEKIK